MENTKPKPNREEKAIILDFLPNGYMNDNRPTYQKKPIAQAIGLSKFTLLELAPKKDIYLQLYQEVYIGNLKREEIHHIIGKIELNKLTNTARAELEHAIKQVVKESPERFLFFFNKSQPLSTRMHSLELLPGLGKKHMWEILDEREIEPFKSFEDLKKRVKLMPDPEKAVIKRILKELKGDEKHYIFVEQKKDKDEDY